MAGPGAAPPAGHILLVGMMGSGKSTVGAALAARLGVAHLDSDAEVRRRTGRSVPEIWRAEGEAAFRAEESRVLADALARPDRCVVDIAGGAVLDPANRAMIRRGGTVVWLRARPETLARRVGSGEGRPLLAGDPAGAVRRLEAQRRPLYSELAECVVDVDDLTPAEVVERVVGAAAAPAGS